MIGALIGGMVTSTHVIFICLSLRERIQVRENL
jgi:hypothetical protein